MCYNQRYNTRIGCGALFVYTMESDLKSKSPCRPNMLFKYADDTNLAVPDITDVTLSDEFLHIKEWAYHNKMIINESKTKEIVFRRPSPRDYICSLLSMTLNLLIMPSCWELYCRIILVLKCMLRTSCQYAVREYFCLRGFVTKDYLYTI